MKPKYLIGGLVILVFVVFASMNLEQSLVAYVSIDEAKASGRTVQIKGARVPNTEAYDPAEKTFNFTIADPDGREVRIVYHGVKPSNFENAKEIVVRGRYQGEVFQADDVLVKCPSKYEMEEFEGGHS